MVDMVVDEHLFGLDQRLFDRAELLRHVDAGPSFLNHLDDLAQMAIGTLERLDHVGVRLVNYDCVLSPGRG